MARFKYLATRNFATPIRTPDGFMIESANELISYWSFFVERECYQKEWGRPLQQAAAPVVLDVGANAGVFSHWIWTLNPRVNLVIFEPLPAMSAKIKNWIEVKQPRATLHAKAVSDEIGHATFYASSGNDTGASLKGTTNHAQQFTVPLTTLDAVITEPDILLAKIDVEGCEVQVLTGAAKTLMRTRHLLLEAHTMEALQAIQKLLPSEIWQCQKVGSSDYLFSRKTTNPSR
ncbi:MAG TPA: FkbM family methyltransferase [Verrucomicrobiae bacterium]